MDRLAGEGAGAGIGPGVDAGDDLDASSISASVSLSGSVLVRTLGLGAGVDSGRSVLRWQVWRESAVVVVRAKAVPLRSRPGTTTAPVGVLPRWGVDAGEVSLEVSDMTAWGWGDGEEWRKDLEMKAADESDSSGGVAFVLRSTSSEDPSCISSSWVTNRC